MKQKSVLILILFIFHSCLQHEEKSDQKSLDLFEKDLSNVLTKDSLESKIFNGKDLESFIQPEHETEEADVFDQKSIPCSNDNECVSKIDKKCANAFCDKETKICVFQEKPDLTPCNDDPCFYGAYCEDGKCNKSEMFQIDCDDRNPCTDDFCKQGVCIHENNNDFCDDNNPCTTGDRCINGICIGNFTKKCECLSNDDCKKFDDNNPCNGKIACIEGMCRIDPQSLVDCSKFKAPPCKYYECDKKTGSCVLKTVKDGSFCDDKNPCTVNTFCKQGECVGKNLCKCKEDDDCKKYDDTNLCNGKLKCKNGFCVLDFNSVVDCSLFDDGDCFYFECNPDSGKCEKKNRLDNTPCVDYNLCTINDRCKSGVCVGDEVSCDDFNVCTKDLCEPDLGCFHQYISAPCDDKNPCTVDDYCFSGKCYSKKFKDCDDKNPCTTDFCNVNTGECEHENLDDAPCDDNNPCTEGDFCKNGECKPGEYVCKECSGDFDCLKYNDDDYCNGILKCVSGKCVVDPESIVVCDDSDDSFCKKNVCVPETGNCELLPVNEGMQCETSNICIIDGKCKNGECVGEPLSCDDNNPCTEDSCDKDKGCVHTPLDNVPCDDNNPCTKGDVCMNGKCESGNENVCNTPCESDDDCKSLDDGNICNGIYTCKNGFCIFDPDSVVKCDEIEEQCKENLCDPVDGVCKILNKPDGTKCDDGDLCTENDVCQNGFCVGESVDCDDKNPCTQDSCSPFAGCIHFNIKGPCEDGNLCTENDFCENGTCVAGNEVICDDKNVCTKDFCEQDKGCVFVDITEELCSDQNPCTKDLCDPKTGCFHEYVCPEYCDNNLDDDGDGKIDCDDPDCADAKVCTGEGLCFPKKEVSCGSNGEEDLKDQDNYDKIISYSCNFGDYSGKEVTFEFSPQCTGKVTVTVSVLLSEKKLFFDVFIINDASGVCDSTNCSNYGSMYYVGIHGKAEVIFNAEENKKYYIVIDGRKNDEGVFNYSIKCDCAF